jgi:hypothetical protein
VISLDSEFPTSNDFDFGSATDVAGTTDDVASIIESIVERASMTFDDNVDIASGVKASVNSSSSQIDKFNVFGTNFFSEVGGSDSTSIAQLSLETALKEGISPPKSNKLCPNCRRPVSKKDLGITISSMNIGYIFCEYSNSMGHSLCSDDFRKCSLCRQQDLVEKNVHMAQRYRLQEKKTQQGGRSSTWMPPVAQTHLPPVAQADSPEEIRENQKLPLARRWPIQAEPNIDLPPASTQ